MASLYAFFWQISNYFREQLQETFFLGSDFVEVKKSGLQACSIKETGSALYKGLFEIFEILEHPFLSKDIRKSIYSGLFSPAGCILYSCKFIKRKLPYIRFF